MGIKSLFGFGQARDKPTNKAADAGYSFLFGRTTSGKPVNETTAMQTTAVYACVRILSEAIASLPVHVYQYKDGGGKEMVIDHPLYQVLHDEPNPEMTSFVFRETLMSHLLIWGNAYAQIICDGAGRVLGLYPLLPNKMDVQRDEKYIDQGHHKRRKIRIVQEGLSQCGGACDFCNGCDNLGGGSVDAFYEPYINGEKELRELNEEYRSNSGLVH